MDNNFNHNKTLRTKVIIMTFFLLIIIMSFTGFINYMTFAANYNNALISTYSVAGNELVRKIEYALLYGKPIDNYYGMNDTLKELKEIIPEVDELNITSPEGEVLYDLNGFVESSWLNENLSKTAAFEQSVISDNISFDFYQEKAYLFLKIKDNNTSHIANLLLIFPSDRFLQINSYFTKQIISCLIITAFLALISLFIVFFRINIFYQKGLINKKRILIALITVIGIAQLFYSGVNYLLFKNAYIDMALTSKNFIENIVEKNLEKVYSKGLTLDDTEGFEEYLESIEVRVPQIEKINLVPDFKTDRPQMITRVDAVIAHNYIDKQMFNISLDMLTVMVISIFFMVELALLAVIIMTREANKHSNYQSSDYNNSHGLVRGLTFLTSLCTYMPLTFVPIVMNNLYQQRGGLPKDVVLGLPLSAEMLGGILAIVLTAWLINRHGWRNVLYWGGIFLIAGNLLSGFSTCELMYVLSRGIAGLGLGLVLMSVRTLVVSLPKTNIAIAQFSAGSMAGLNCGVVIGGMLADRIGYEAVFYLSALTVIIPLLFVKRLMTNLEIQHKETSSIKTWTKLLNFISDRKSRQSVLCNRGE